MTRIGVISDTHGRLADAAYAALADSDYIIHAGDIGGPAIIRELETLAPVYAVLGNNDFSEYGDVGQIARPCIDGVRFCKLTQWEVTASFVCKTWEMSDGMRNAGLKNGGVVRLRGTLEVVF